MTFLIPLALLALAAAVGPIVAHALRQGRSRAVAFPATRFVRAHQATTKERRRLQDKWLLAIRLLSIMCLAALGATPLASCSRLSLSRDRGASVAVLLVVDDSASMQVEAGRQTRLDQALSAARELLQTARSGDAVGIVLAGRPARLLLPPTTDLARAKSALSDVTASDRSTDLDAALSLADDALARLPQTDKQIVLLSDLATTSPLRKTTQTLTIPLPELAKPFDNCGLLRARRESGQVSVEIACTPGSVRAGRQVELLDRAGKRLASAELVETVDLPIGDDSSGQATVRLTEARGSTRDQIPGDDVISVEPKASSFVVGLCADAKRSGLPTSGTTVLRAGLEALEENLAVDPVAVLPDHPAELEGMAALVIDDPPGLTPEAASVLEGFVQQGGVVLTLLGRQVEAAPLGAVFQPLVAGAPTWSDVGARGVEPNSAGMLGVLAQGWSDLPAHGRVVVPDQPGETRVAVRFADGQPLVLERPLGQGLFITTLLPSSVEVSDFALRPAFLALLDRVLYEARLRSSFAASEVGEPWEVPEGTTVTGPDGDLPILLEGGRALVVPARAGRYTLRVSGKDSPRFALRNAAEATLQPRKVAPLAAAQRSAHAKQSTDISREVALALLLLMLVELGIRARKRLPSRPRAGQGALL